MKKLIVGATVLALLLSLTLLAGCGGNKVPEGAIAAVGDGVVTQDQFEAIWQQAEAQYKARKIAFPTEGTADYSSVKASIVSYLVQNELLKQKAADMGVSVTTKEFDKYMTQIVQQAGGQAKLDALLKKQNMTAAQARDAIKAQMLTQKVQQKVMESIKISDADIKAYYEDPKNKRQFIASETVEARHILNPSKAKVLAARKLLEADDSDANWKAVAAKYSMDPGSKDKGGNLGAFPKGRMMPEFEKVAFGIKPGTLSAPVKTQWGWHVIEVTKKNPPSNVTYEQAKSMIEQQLKYQRQATAWDDWLKQALKDADVVYAVGFNPELLTASPSPSASASPAE